MEQFTERLKDEQGNVIELENVAVDTVDGTLSDEQVEELANTLELGLSDANKRMRDFVNDTTIVDDGTYPRNVLAMDEASELGEVAVMMEVNHETGETKVLGPVTDATNDKYSNASIFASKEEIQSEQMESLKSNVKDFGIDVQESEYLDLYKVIDMRRKGEKIALNQIPKSIMDMVYKMSGSKTSPQNKGIAMNLIDFTMSQMDIDKEFLDFQQALAKELDLNSGMLTEYHNNLDEVMTVKTLERAAELEKEGKEEQAKALRGISEEYVNATSFSTINYLIDSEDPIVNKLRKDIKKIKRLYTDFNYKYSKTNYKVDNIALAETVLKRNLTEVTEEQILKFMALFCKSTVEMNPANPGEHTYMYYTLKTILSLDFLNDVEKRNALKDRLIATLSKL